MSWWQPFAASSPARQRSGNVTVLSARAPRLLRIPPRSAQEALSTFSPIRQPDRAPGNRRRESKIRPPATQLLGRCRKHGLFGHVYRRILVCEGNCWRRSERASLAPCSTHPCAGQCHSRRDGSDGDRAAPPERLLPELL